MRILSFHPRHLEFVYGANPIDNCFFDDSIQIDSGTVIWPGVTVVEGAIIGKNCELGKGVTISGKIIIGHNVKIKHHVEITGEGYIGSKSQIGQDIHNPQIGKNCNIGDIDGKINASVIGDNCEIGPDAEVKRSIVGHDTNAKHICGIRDAIVGHEVNFSGGAQVWNYDGSAKKKTQIGSRVFVGGGVRIMGGIKIGDESFVAESSLVSQNIPEKSFFINKTPGSKVETINDNCSWYLDGNYLNLKYPIELKLRESFYVKAYRLCGQSSDAMKLWLKTPSQHMGGRTPIECIKKEGDKSFACLLGECGYPEKNCRYNNRKLITSNPS